MIYLLILFYLLILSYQYDFLKKSAQRSLHYFIVMAVLILVAGFRYRIGIDSIRYEMDFEGIPTLGTLSLNDFSEQKYDPLYLLLAVICRSISNEFWVLQMAQAVLVNIIFFRFFKKNTDNIFLAILIYYFILYAGNMFETMRESCAVAMMLLSWEFYKKNRRFVVLFFFSLAFLFHSSAILLFFVYIPIILKIDRRIIFSKNTLLIVSLILLFAFTIQDFFLDNLVFFALNSRFADKIDLYTSNNMFEDKLNIFGVIASIVLYGIIPYICASTIRKTKDSYKLEYFLVIELLCAVMAFPIYIFYRYVNYFFPFVILAMCKSLSFKCVNIFGITKFSTKRIAIWLILSFPFVITQTKLMLSSEWPSGPQVYSRYYPYSSIFTKKEDADREAIFSQYIWW